MEFHKYYLKKLLYLEKEFLEGQNILVTQVIALFLKDKQEIKILNKIMRHIDLQGIRLYMKVHEEQQHNGLY